MFSGTKQGIKKPLLALLLLAAVFPVLVAGERLTLSATEQQWLDSIEVIRLCSDPDWMPYEAIGKSGQYIGIMSDFHELWSDMIAKPVKIQVTGSWEQALQFMQQKKCDVLSSAQDLPSRRHYLSVTQPFINYPFAVATQPDQQFIINLLPLMDKTFAMVKGYAGVELIRSRYPDINLRLVDSARAGLKQVEKGQVYGFIDTVPSINYQTLKHGISHIKISGVLEQYYSMSVGVRRDLPLLLSIYNKAITETHEVERQRILNNWLSLEFDYKINTTLIWQVLAGVLLLSCLFFYHYYTVKRTNRQLQLANRQLEHVSRRDHLTGMPNRLYLQEAFESELERYHRYGHVFSLLILDIDHFKRINDAFGHVVGDEILKRISDLLTQNLRGADIAGRWGGEEFLILCPETDLQGAWRLAEQLRTLIGQTDFGIDKMSITASLGVTDFRDDEMIEDCIKRADQALYRAKHRGRNQTISF
ncbi:diguanylate cyclase [Methylophaga sp.]|uniref:diguanylate cyclase n=1 Tax=Methylophaga sp. TaxID=2024840 RepID=UPI0014006BC0|nr:diguanylate cyclase [Methylophaga sp.]MTI64541.1 diguanylate cyclase [Methylophaga sp.]